MRKNKQKDLESIKEDIASTIQGNGWCGSSPYKAEILDGNIVITYVDTGDKYLVSVSPLKDKDLKIKKKQSSGLYSPDVGLKGFW